MFWLESKQQNRYLPLSPSYMFLDLTTDVLIHCWTIDCALTPNNHVSVKNSMKMLLWRLWGEVVALIPCSISAEGLKLMLNILFWPVSDSSINPCARHFCCQCSQSASFLLFFLPSCYWKYKGAYFVTVLMMQKQICRQD